MDAIRLSRADWQWMRDYVHLNLPEESCGILGGMDGQIEAILPVENSAHSTASFTMNPAQLIKALYYLKNQSLDLVGMFHSHPQGPSYPSLTDILEFNYPGTMVMIWSRQFNEEWRAASYLIQDEKFSQIPMMLMD